MGSAEKRDTTAFQVAQSAIGRDWLFPQDTPWLFFGFRYANLAAQTHLPVGEYYLAVLLKLFGGVNVAAFRAFYAVFPLVAAWTTTRAGAAGLAAGATAACILANGAIQRWEGFGSDAEREAV